MITQTDKRLKDERTRWLEYYPPPPLEKTYINISINIINSLFYTQISIYVLYTCMSICITKLQVFSNVYNHITYGLNNLIWHCFKEKHLTWEISWIYCKMLFPQLAVTNIKKERCPPSQNLWDSVCSGYNWIQKHVRCIGIWICDTTDLYISN